METIFTPDDFPPNPVEKEGYILEFQDEFDGPRIDTHKWVPFYLPHWSSRSRSAPNYTFKDGCLVLQITRDQQPWCPEFDGDVKASAIQSGEFAGPPGSPIGQHRFNPACAVREAQTNQSTYTPQYGFFECRAKGLSSAGNHVALWMIGYQDAPQRSGEINIFEIMGAHATPASSRVGIGVRPWADPHLKDEFLEEFFPIDAARFHAYGLEWTPTHLDFYIDNRKIKTINQSPGYPMQFFLSIYELPGRDPGAEYPKEFAIDYFRGYQPVGGY